MNSYYSDKFEGCKNVLITGVWDMFHYGHAEAMQQIKKNSNYFLVVGIYSDATVQKMKGRVVLKYDERRALLNHIKWIDKILDDIPWEMNSKFLQKHNIDYLAGSENFLKRFAFSTDIDVKNDFIPVTRVSTISTEIILNRIIRNYDLFLEEFTKKQSNIFDIGIYESKQPKALSNFRPPTNKGGLSFLGHNFRTDIYIKKFGQSVLNTWNVLAAVKNLIIQANKYKLYPAKNAVQKSLFDRDDCLKPMLHRIATRFVSGWSDVKMDDIEISLISGGLTNRLFKVSIDPVLAAEINQINANKNNDFALHVPIPHQVLIKLYGPGTDLLFDRYKEHTIVQRFSELEMGPRIYGIFSNGRVEEFLSLHSLEQNDLQKLAPLISQKLAKIHSCKIPDLIESPSLFNSLWSWLKIVQDITFDKEKDKQEILDSLDVSERLPMELEFLEEQLKTFNSPVVFCHNDLLAGNIMYDRETQELCFIDYEYGSYNFRGFDIGNHFCERSISYNVSEYPYFAMDSKKYPNKEQQTIFLKNYLKTLNGREASEEEILALMREVNAFALAAHLLWGLWAIIQATVSEIEFGYMEFSKARLDAYYKNKNKFLYNESFPDDVDDSVSVDNDNYTVLERSSHNFKKSHFNTPTWCGHCKFFIFQPFGKQGYRCMCCNMKIHQKCLALVKSHCITINPGSMWVEL